MYPTREPEDILVPSRYRANKYEPHMGALVRYRLEYMPQDHLINGEPIVPLFGYIVGEIDTFDGISYVVRFIDDLAVGFEGDPEEETYQDDEIIVVAPKGTW